MTRGLRGVSVVLIIAAFLGLFAGCYDKREIDDLAYAIAMGFDKGNSNSIKVTLQIAKPGATGGGGGGGGEGEGGKESSFNTVLEAPTIYTALDMANTYISRRLNVSNAVVLVFSRELAQQGIESYINAFKRGREFRPSMYVLVSRTTAEDYITNVKPLLEASPAKYYVLNTESSKYTAFTANSQLYNFSNNIDSQDRQAVAILAGVNQFENSSEINSLKSTFKAKGKAYPLAGDYKAGDMPKVSDIKSEIMGLAVFDGDKMVGELDGEETAYYQMITGEYRFSLWTLPDPRQEGTFIVLNILRSRIPNKKVDIVDGKPVISTEVSLEADVVSIQSGINYELGDNSILLENYVQDYLEKGMTDVLNRTAKEYHSDIFGFGKLVKSKFLTMSEFESFRWKSRYEDSSFNVKVDMKIRRPGLLVRSSQPIST